MEVKTTLEPRRTFELVSLSKDRVQITMDYETLLDVKTALEKISDASRSSLDVKQARHNFAFERLIQQVGTNASSDLFDSMRFFNELVLDIASMGELCDSLYENIADHTSKHDAVFNGSADGNLKIA